MGGFKETYLNYETSGDQYVDHCDSSLDITRTVCMLKEISLIFLLLKMYKNSMLRGRWIDG